MCGSLIVIFLSSGGKGHQNLLGRQPWGYLFLWMLSLAKCTTCMSVFGELRSALHRKVWLK